MVVVFSTSRRYRIRASTRLSALALFILVTAPVVAAPLATYLKPAATSRLVGGESIRQASSGKDMGLTLAPDHQAADMIRSAVATEESDIFVEALFLWQKPGAGAPEAEILAVYNVLRSISTLQGLEYYSASRKKIRPLYVYSSLIAGLNDPSPVRDSQLQRLPPVPETLYARQNDTTFGDNQYRITLTGGMDFVTQHSTNLTRLSLGIVPVAGPGDVNVRLLVLSVDEGLLFYAASSARAAVVPGVRGKLETSFGNRAEAVYNWFSSELAATWPKQR
ncbi:MAG: hypothetical protein A2Y38_03585 [Spirochaetes bacterium GWB1_59_5]|nr:MAG: hypothetical protein A2Y38_03585 [Spirochaetes bacterium GWB1_59_5]